MRIVVRHPRSSPFQQLHDGVGGRLAIVVHVRLVGEPQKQHTRSADRLAGVVEGVHDPRHHVVGHRRVDLAGELDQPRALPILEGLPREVEGVDGDAMAAQAGPGIEGHEAEWLRRGRIDHLPHVDSHLRVDHLELVDQCDIDRSEDVFRELRGLGDAAAGNRNDLLDDPPVEVLGPLPAGRRQSADDFWNLRELAPRISRILTLRREAQMKITAGDEAAAFLEDRPHDVFRGARVCRRFKHDQVAFTQVRGQGLSRTFDIGKIRSSVGGERRGHADQYRPSLGRLGEVCRGGKAALSHCRRHVGVRDVLDVGTALLETRHLHTVDVDSQNPRAGPGKGQA